MIGVLIFIFEFNINWGVGWLIYGKKKKQEAKASEEDGEVEMNPLQTQFP